MVDLRRRVTITAVSVIQFVDMCLLSTPGGTQLALARVVDVVRAADRCVMWRAARWQTAAARCSVLHQTPSTMTTCQRRTRIYWLWRSGRRCTSSSCSSHSDSICTHVFPQHDADLRQCPLHNFENYGGLDELGAKGHVCHQKCLRRILGTRSYDLIAAFFMLHLVCGINSLYLFVNLILVPVRPFPTHLLLHSSLLPLLIHHSAHP